MHGRGPLDRWAGWLRGLGLRRETDADVAFVYACLGPFRQRGRQHLPPMVTREARCVGQVALEALSSVRSSIRVVLVLVSGTDPVLAGVVRCGWQLRSVVKTMMRRIDTMDIAPGLSSVWSTVSMK